MAPPIFALVAWWLSVTLCFTHDKNFLVSMRVDLENSQVIFAHDITYLCAC